MSQMKCKVQKIVRDWDWLSKRVRHRHLSFRDYVKSPLIFLILQKKIQYTIHIFEIPRVY